MKKYLFIIVLIAFTISSNACEICGCGVGNFYMGVLPNFKKGFIGARYQYNNYHTVIASDATQYSNDYFKTIELWGGINLGKKWQLLGFVPYNFNKQNSDDGATNNIGLGDITLMGNYKLLNNFSSSKSKFFEQSLLIGGGIKLPTGKFDADLSDPTMVAASTINTQIGSGSVDFFLNGMYNVKWNKFGINSSVIYKINTTNGSSVRYGNKATINATTFYNIGSDELVLSPTVGLSYENLAANFHNNAAIEDTGGNALMATTGLQIKLNKISVGAVFNTPLSQNFSDNQTNIKSKGTLQFTFAL